MSRKVCKADKSLRSTTRFLASGNFTIVKEVCRRNFSEGAHKLIWKGTTSRRKRTVLSWFRWTWHWRDGPFRLKGLLHISTDRLLNHSVQLVKESPGPNTATLLNGLIVHSSCRDPFRLDNEDESIHSHLDFHRTVISTFYWIWTPSRSTFVAGSDVHMIATFSTPAVLLNN